jgi:putative ABC transport system permease protein
MTVLVGPAEVPLVITGWVDDTNYLLQNALWVEPETWRAVQNANRPDAPVADDEFQVFVVRAAEGADGGALPALVDGRLGGTESLSESDAAFAVPGVTEQNRTFSSVIGVTVFVAGLVVALFFALLTIERQAQYAMFKALGASSSRLVAGVVVQSAAVAAGAFALGGLLTFGLSLVIPPAVPAQFEPSRVIFTLVAVLAASLIGSLISLRRIFRIDPATALGAGA